MRLGGSCDSTIRRDRECTAGRICGRIVSLVFCMASLASAGYRDRLRFVDATDSKLPGGKSYTDPRKREQTVQEIHKCYTHLFRLEYFVFRTSRGIPGSGKRP